MEVSPPAVSQISSGFALHQFRHVRGFIKFYLNYWYFYSGSRNNTRSICKYCKAFEESEFCKISVISLKKGVLPPKIWI